VQHIAYNVFEREVFVGVAADQVSGRSRRIARRRTRYPCDFRGGYADCIRRAARRLWFGMWRLDPPLVP